MNRNLHNLNYNSSSSSSSNNNDASGYPYHEPTARVKTFTLDFFTLSTRKSKRLPSSMDGQLALDFHNEQMFAIDIDTDIHIYMIHDVHHDYDAQGVP